MYKMYCFAKFCRLCLERSDNLLDFKTKDSDNITLINKINVLMPSLIISNENFPTLICDKCYLQLNNSYNFISNCFKSNQHLVKYSVQLNYNWDRVNYKLDVVLHDFEKLDKPEDVQLNSSDDESLIDSLIYIPLENTMKQPIGNPIGDPIEYPIRNPSGFSIEDPIGNPSVDPIEDPVGHPSGDPIEDPIGNLSGDPIEDPIGDPIEDPIEDPIGDPIEGVTKKLATDKTGSVKGVDDRFVVKINGDEGYTVIVDTNSVKGTGQSPTIISSDDEADENKIYTINISKNVLQSEPSANGFVSTSEKKLYACSICAKKFKDINSLKYHKHVVHDSRKHECKHCGTKVANLKLLSVHLKRCQRRREAEGAPPPRLVIDEAADEAPATPQTDEGPPKCHICKKVFVSRGGLKNHYRHIHAKGRHRCQICHERFVTFKELCAHRNLLHPRQLSKKIRCTLCGDRFATQALFKEHQEEHGVRSCTMCRGTFPDLALLKMHYRHEHKIKPDRIDTILNIKISDTSGNNSENISGNNSGNNTENNSGNSGNNSGNSGNNSGNSENNREPLKIEELILDKIDIKSEQMDIYDNYESNEEYLLPD